MSNKVFDQNKKLELEIKILEKKLEDLNRVEQHSFFDKVWLFIKDSLPTLMLVISIIGAAITIGIQSGNYIEEKKKENEIRVDEQMLSLMMELEDEEMSFKERDKKLMLLTQYKRNAIPVILLYLRYNHDENDYLTVMESLRSLQQKVDNETFIKDLINYTDNLFWRMINLRFTEQEPSVGLKWHVKVLREFDNERNGDIDKFLIKWRNNLESFKNQGIEICNDDCKNLIDDIIKEINK